ncbi:MAG TPA: hypothetical protein DCR21_02235 [Succinivibrionaceae bacterium]|nr:hypothetical protein [Succinivibrionaceae bacterium]
MLKVSYFKNSSKSVPVICSLALALCCISPAQADTTYPIAVTTYTYTDLFMNHMRNSIHKYCKQEQVQCVFFDGDNNEKTQMDFVNSKINENMAVAVAPVEPTSQNKPIINSANNQKVPSILFNRGLNPEDLKNKKQAWYVSSRESDVGLFQGQMIEEYLKTHKDWDKNGNGKLDILLFKGAKDHYSVKIRTDRVLEYLEKAGIEYDIVEEFNCDWLFENGYSSMKEYLVGNALEDIEFIVSNNDDMALGAIAAMDDIRVELDSSEEIYVPVVGVDGVKDALSAVAHGQMLGTVLQDADEMSKIIVLTASGKVKNAKELSEVTGHPYKSRYVLVPYKKIDKSVAEDLMKASAEK